MITIGLGLGNILILSIGLTLPVDRLQNETSIPTSPDGVPEPIMITSSETTPVALPPQETFIQLAARDYRQRLFDLPSVAPAPPAAPKPLPVFRLVGTILNPSQPRAMISDARDQVTLKTIGDRIGDESNFAVITSIESKSITLEHEGLTVSVKKE